MMRTSTCAFHLTDRVRWKPSTCGLKLTVREVEALSLLLEEELRMKRDESFDKVPALPALLLLWGFGGISSNHETSVMLL
jgi:hypothetical protein